NAAQEARQMQMLMRAYEKAGKVDPGPGAAGKQRAEESIREGGRFTKEKKVREPKSEQPKSPSLPPPDSPVAGRSGGEHPTPQKSESFAKLIQDQTGQSRTQVFEKIKIAKTIKEDDLAELEKLNITQADLETISAIDDADERQRVVQCVLNCEGRVAL